MVLVECVYAIEGMSTVYVTYKGIILKERNLLRSLAKWSGVSQVWSENTNGQKICIFMSNLKVVFFAVS